MAHAIQFQTRLTDGSRYLQYSFMGDILTDCYRLVIVNSLTFVVHLIVDDVVKKETYNTRVFHDNLI